MPVLLIRGIPQSLLLGQRRLDFVFPERRLLLHRMKGLRHPFDIDLLELLNIVQDPIQIVE
jgi:hypothetical protein